MYKIFILIIFSIVCSQYVSQEKSLSDEEILAFWTPERIKNTKPLPIPIIDIHGAPSSNQTKFATVPVPEPYSSSPYKAVGRLFFSIGTGTASCTACAIGGNVVLTAGHCVHNGNNAFYTNFVFVPQYNNGNQPLGTWISQKQWTTAEWATGNGRAYAKDVGVIKVNSRLGRTVEQVIGHKYQPIFNQPRIFPAVTLGYPGNIDNSKKMIMSDGVSSEGHSFYVPKTLKMPSTMTFGASGGSW